MKKCGYDTVKERQYAVKVAYDFLMQAKREIRKAIRNEFRAGCISDGILEVASGISDAVFAIQINNL